MGDDVLDDPFGCGRARGEYRLVGFREGIQHGPDAVPQTFRVVAAFESEKDFS